MTLYPLRQLMTPFHDSSENFYGDVGQVKVAVRRDSTLAECVRLQQLARQVDTTINCLVLLGQLIGRTFLVSIV